MVFQRKYFKRKFFIHPLVLPKILPFIFGDDPSYLGDSITVQCSITSGDLPVKFKWFLHDKIIAENIGIKIGSFGRKTSVISIDTLSEKHAGNYTCLAENIAGTNTYSTELIVKGLF